LWVITNSLTTEYGDVKINIPANSLADSDVIIKFNLVGQGQIYAKQMSEILTTLVGNIYELAGFDKNGQPKNINLSSGKYLTIMLPYPDIEEPKGIVDKMDIQTNRLKIFMLDNSEWKMQKGSEIDKEHNLIKLQTQSFGIYSIRAFKNLDIISYTVYPNPFKDKVIFAINLSAPADEITIKIYTLTGKLVKTIQTSATDSAGYKTIDWFGKDDKEDILSVGTYIYKLTVRDKERKIEKIGKLTILR